MSVGKKRGNKVSSLQVSSMDFYVLLFFLTYFLIKVYGIKLLLCKGTLPFSAANTADFPP